MSSGGSSKIVKVCFPGPPIHTKVVLRDLEELYTDGLWIKYGNLMAM